MGYRKYIVHFYIGNIESMSINLAWAAKLNKLIPGTNKSLTMSQKIEKTNGKNKRRNNFNWGNLNCGECQ